MKKLLFLLLTVISICSCKKPQEPVTPPTNPPDADTVSLNDNVVVIDSTKMILNNDSTLINQGQYNFSYSTAIPEIKANDVIIGATNGGYIRRVTSVDKQTGKITLETTQGDMEDVFKKANFNFSIKSENLNVGNGIIHTPTIDGPVTQKQTFDLNDIVVYQNGPLSIKLKKANVTIDGDWNFGFNFEKSTLDTFEMSCKNATLNAQCEWNISATQAITLAQTESSLKTFSKYFIVEVPIGVVPVPVVVKMKIDFVAQFSASISAQVERDLTINNNSSLNLGLTYKNSEWQSIYTKTSNSTVVAGERTGNVNAEIHLGIIPKIEFLFYRVAGPYSSFGLKELVKGDVASPALDWDFYAGTWLQSILGAKAEILGKTLTDYNKEWNTDTFYYQTPDRILKVSGDNQKGTSGQYLSQALKVKVVDNVGNAQSNVPVYFNVVIGGGSVENTSILSDSSGYATTRWKLGNQNSSQSVEASVKKADGTLINDAPIEFVASVNQDGDSTFIDSRDGQVYTFRHIGTQVWMTQNLNYDAVNSKCYDNNSANCDIYGHLYNWNSISSIAPSGWHVPTDVEWTNLIDYLGGAEVAGGKMKKIDTTLWMNPNVGADNSSGFGALPGSLGYSDGSFGNSVDGLGYTCIWLSSTEDPPPHTQVWTRIIRNYDAGIGRADFSKVNWYSVRCIRN